MLAEFGTTHLTIQILTLQYARLEQVRRQVESVAPPDRRQPARFAHRPDRCRSQIEPVVRRGAVAPHRPGWFAAQCRSDAGSVQALAPANRALLFHPQREDWPCRGRWRRW